MSVREEIGAGLSNKNFRFIMKVLIVDNKQNISNPLSTFLKVKGFENVVTNDEKKDLIRVKVRNLKSLVEEIFEFRKFLNLGNFWI